MATTTLHVDYVAANDASLKAPSNSHRLATLTFGDADAPASDALSIHVALPIATGTCYAEVWTSSTAVERTRSGRLDIATTGDAALVSLVIPNSGTDVERAGHAAYSELLDYLQQHNYPHLIRTWNYFPAINAQHHGEERYQRFCVGRYRAFSERYHDFLPLLPAATAIGTHDGDITLFVLASKTPGMHIENPRQVSAYAYPRQYGRVSPSFARATVKSWGDELHLYVSGTASIVGHESLHIGRVQDQLNEIGANLDALATTCRAHSLRIPTMPALRAMDYIKVYIRDPAHAETIRHAIEHHFYRTAPTLYLLGDVCREELLVEVEGMWRVGAHDNENVGADLSAK